jgi:RNA polymerase sigma factor (TIGR02999 family)
MLRQFRPKRLTYEERNLPLGLFAPSRGILISEIIGIPEAFMVDSRQPDHRLSDRSESPDFLVTVLYQELHRLAAGCLRRERPNHTLQPTALVNEAYLRLALQNQPRANDRVQFLAVASHLMREVLIDYARTRNRAKRGGGLAPIQVEDFDQLAAAGEVDLLALDEALDGLERIDSQQRRIVEMRYFGGLSIEETAQVLGVSPATVKRDWRMARAWLHRELSPVSA